MLASFIVKRHFCGLDVSIHVDVAEKEATLSASYNRRLAIVAAPIGFWEAHNPETAEHYLSRNTGERGSFVESMHWQAKNGVGAFAPVTEAALTMRNTPITAHQRLIQSTKGD
jgi:hypothetical protein